MSHFLHQVVLISLGLLHPKELRIGWTILKVPFSDNVEHENLILASLSDQQCLNGPRLVEESHKVMF